MTREEFLSTTYKSAFLNATAMTVRVEDCLWTRLPHDAYPTNLRQIWELCRGSMPADTAFSKYYVGKTCDTLGCVNPEHLCVVQEDTFIGRLVGYLTLAGIIALAVGFLLLLANAGGGGRSAPQYDGETEHSYYE